MMSVCQKIRQKSEPGRFHRDRQRERESKSCENKQQIETNDGMPG